MSFPCADPARQVFARTIWDDTVGIGQFRAIFDDGREGSAKQCCARPAASHRRKHLYRQGASWHDGTFPGA